MSETRHLQSQAYRRAQRAMADLKAATQQILSSAGDEGLRNSQVGRLLGIYKGHVGHEGHISRTMLQMLQEEGVVEQDGPGGRWRLKDTPADSSED